MEKIIGIMVTSVLIGVLIGVLICFGCNSNTSEEQKPQEQKMLSCTEYKTGYLVTVLHDGHWFVVEGRFQKVAIIHHPSCPCFAESKK